MDQKYGCLILPWLLFVDACVVILLVVTLGKVVLMVFLDVVDVVTTDDAAVGVIWVVIEFISSFWFK